MAENTINGKRYIGVSRKGLPYRQARHISLAVNGSKSCPRLYDAIRKYSIDAFMWKVLAICRSYAEALNKEVELITSLKPEYNVAGGGAGTVGVRSPNRKKIICLDDGAIYESMTEAASAHNASSGDMCIAVRVGYAVRGKYFCLYTAPLSERERIDTIRSIKANMIQNRRRVEKRKLDWLCVVNGSDKLGRRATGPMKNSRPVICVDDNRVFPSASKAAAEYDIAKSSIIELCLGKNNRVTAGGKIFAYIDGDE